MDIAARERAYVRVAGPDACDYLQRMVSNDVEALQVGDACPALLLTAKARVIAPLVVWRRGEDDFLVLTEPELGEPVRALLTRMRLRARCEIELEEHSSALVFGGDGIATDFPGAREVLDAGLEPTLDDDELERRRDRGGRAALGPRARRPRAAGGGRARRDAHQLLARAATRGRSRSRGCTTAARRTAALRVLELDDVPPYDAELVHDGKVVGRVTSAARRPDGSVVALALRPSRGAGRRAARARTCRGLSRPTGGRFGARRT